MKRVFSRALVIGADLALSLFFGLGLANAIFNQRPIGLMAIYIGSLLISAVLSIGWLVKPWRQTVWWWRLNLVWTIGWGLYFLGIIVLIVIAMNQLSSLG